MAKTFAVLLALLLTAWLAACSPETPVSAGSTDSSDSTSSSPGSQGDDASSEADPPAGKPVELPAQMEKIAAAAQNNPDTVGWIYIPGLDDIDDAVVQSTESNTFYEDLDKNGDYTFDRHIDGAYFTHKDNTFGEFSMLSRNTVIFGHSSLGLYNGYQHDEPNDKRFSQLFHFTDEEFARKTPYIFFSTAEEDMVWEIFAVFYNDAGTWYIAPRVSGRDWDYLMETSRARSLYDYDVEVSPGDNLLTLSTCTVEFGWADHNEYRFVIMAKRVEPEEATKTEAAFTVNPDPEMPNEV